MYDLIDLGVGIAAQRDEHLVYVNMSLARLLHYRSPAGLLGRPIWELVHPSAHAELRAHLARSREGDHSPYLTTLVTAAGLAEPVCVFPHDVPDDSQPNRRSSTALSVGVILSVRSLGRIPGMHLEAVAPPAAATLQVETTMLEIGRDDRDEEPDWFGRLTERETQVVRKITSGLAIARIALQLGISANTVRNHLKSIYRKLRVRSQTELLSRFIVRNDSRSLELNVRGR